MRYRLKCLTPLLAGDGRKLCPIGGYSQPISSSQRQKDNRVLPLFGLGCRPHQQ
jgi:uncharacterized Zn finger protein (UPF0148 family)